MMTSLDDGTYLTLLQAGYKTPEIEKCRVQFMKDGFTDEGWCDVMRQIAEATRTGEFPPLPVRGVE